MIPWVLSIEFKLGCRFMDCVLNSFEVEDVKQAFTDHSLHWSCLLAASSLQAHTRLGSLGLHSSFSVHPSCSIHN